jgi:alpha-glucosidase
LDQQLWRQRLDWDEATGQCYYHAYLAEQPDLNWRKPNAQAAMREALRFLVAARGRRVDVMWHLIKDAAFRDNPPNPAWPGA